MAAQCPTPRARASQGDHRGSVEANICRILVTCDSSSARRIAPSQPALLLLADGGGHDVSSGSGQSSIP